MRDATLAWTREVQEVYQLCALLHPRARPPEIFSSHAVYLSNSSGLLRFEGVPAATWWLLLIAPRSPPGGAPRHVLCGLRFAPVLHFRLQMAGLRSCAHVPPLQAGRSGSSQWNLFLHWGAFGSGTGTCCFSIRHWCSPFWSPTEFIFPILTLVFSSFVWKLDYDPSKDLLGLEVDLQPRYEALSFLSSKRNTLRCLHLLNLMHAHIIHENCYSWKLALRTQIDLLRIAPR